MPRHTLESSFWCLTSCTDLPCWYDGQPAAATLQEETTVQYVLINLKDIEAMAEEPEPGQPRARARL